MGYALSARGIFAQAQKCRMYQSRPTFPQGVALGYGQHLGLQPAPIIYPAFCKFVRIHVTFVPSRHLTHDFTLFPCVFPNFLGIFARFALLLPCSFPQKCLLLHLKGAVALSLHFDFYFAFAIISRLAKSLGNSVWIKSTKIICEGLPRMWLRPELSISNAHAKWRGAFL